jgi:hypothetical protein
MLLPVFEIVGITDNNQSCQSLRYSGGNWQQLEPIPGAPSQGVFQFGATGAGSADGAALQVVGLYTSAVWYTLRNANGVWQPFQAIPSPSTSDGFPDGGFVDVKCAGAGGVLYVVGLDSNGMTWYTIIQAGGTPSPFTQIPGQERTFARVACAAIGSALNVFGLYIDGDIQNLANGSLYWSVLNTDVWSGFSLVQDQPSGVALLDVACAVVGGSIHVVGVSIGGNSSVGPSQPCHSIANTT